MVVPVLMQTTAGVWACVPVTTAMPVGSPPAQCIYLYLSSLRQIT